MKNIFLLLATFLLLTSCSAAKQHRYDKSPCKSKYKTSAGGFTQNIFINCDNVI